MITKLKKLAKILTEAVGIINEIVAEDEKTDVTPRDNTAGNSSFSAKQNNVKWLQ